MNNRRGFGQLGILVIALVVLFVAGILSFGIFSSILATIPSWVWFVLIGVILLRWLTQ